MQPREDKQKRLDIKRSRQEGKPAPISGVCTPPVGGWGAGSTSRAKQGPAAPTIGMGRLAWTTRHLEQVAHPGKPGGHQSRAETVENRENTARPSCSQGAKMRTVSYTELPTRRSGQVS